MAKRIDNVPVPFEGKLPVDISHGTFIKIAGKPTKNSQRFAINLLTESGDIAFHLNPRIKEGFIVRNSRISSDWCNEEKDKIMPFLKETPFILSINVEKEYLRLYLNGVYLLAFKHRLPFHTITSIGIDGDVEVHSIEGDCCKYEVENEFEHEFNANNRQVQSYFEPPMPFTEEIKPNGLMEGMVFSVRGKPETDCQKFDINLIQSKTDPKNPDIALHVSCRFGKKADDQVIVRNHKLRGKWGEEERRGPEFPFRKERVFDLRIITEKNRFVLTINGQRYAEFDNKLYPLSNTDKIEIRSEGKFRLYAVRF